MKITFRPITEKDKPFLARLYASTRKEELEPVPWTQQQKDDFLQWQFEAQHIHYMTHYQNANFDIIVMNKRDIGRLYLHHREDEIRIVDIALLPQYRGQGIGGKLLHDVLAEGQRSGKTVSIHVESNNPALHLYQRLGFEHVDEHGIYFLMVWKPQLEEA